MSLLRSFTRLWWFVFAIAGAGCSVNQDRAPMLELLDASLTGINFSNTLQEDERLNIITFEYMYNGAGVGVADINNDGLQDLLFTANMSQNKLYLNKGNFSFEDITATSGLQQSGKWATGVSAIDINQDGWMDFYVCYSGPHTDPGKRANELYINNRNNTFTELAAIYGLADTGHSVHAAFLDYDRDGDLDMYLLTNTTDRTGPNIIRPKRLKGEMINTDRLYRNNGDDTFTNVSGEAGILVEGYGLGVSVCDFNQDGWPDIYVSNDYLSNDLLYINNKNGTFTDRAGEYFDHTSYSAMGNDVADYNNDGIADIVSVDMLPPDNKRQKLMFGATNYDRYRSEIKTGYTPQFMRNSLQLGRGVVNGNLVFSEIGQFAGIAATDWSWSPLFADFDNDGLRDLLITNGYPRDITNRDFASYKANEFMHQGYSDGLSSALLSEVNKLEGAYLPNFAFHNNGDLTFSDSSAMWGFRKPSYSTGAAYVDLDNDGDLDYVTNNTNEVSSVFRNNNREQSGRHYLRIALEGPENNRSGLGAKVTVSSSGRKQYTEHYPYRGFQSTVDNILHFGLGGDSLISMVEITWPDGKVQKLTQQSADQTLKLSYRDASDQELIPATIPDTYFKSNSENHILFKHNETHYADFKVQPLLPQKYSQNGPGMAVADVNGDGLDDFFAGGAYNQSGVVHIQKAGGLFDPRPLTMDVKYEEDLGAVFFDLDGDNDQDLYVVSGGNEFKEKAPSYQDRMYLNDGRGNFSLATDRIPKETSSGSCVIAADYDRDGDMDLFVGGRIRPQHYPEGGESFILENREGILVDVTDTVAPGLRTIGMVTAALWTDVDNDDQLDLIVVGEWMPVQIYKQQEGGFTNVTNREGLNNTSGWWNSITGADVDADGDVDYVLGNLGTNSRHQSGRGGAPLLAYQSDYNNDGVDEVLLSQQIKGVSYPAHPRDDLFLQLPSYKKYYTSYASYSMETMDGLLARNPDAHPRILQADILMSSLLINEGSSHWILKPLPVDAQFAPVFGILADDFTGDAIPDILITGNSEAPDVLTGKYDALKGLLLEGDGHGNFEPLSIQRSGWMVDGDAKSLVQLSAGKVRTVLAVQNDDRIKSFRSRDTFTRSDLQASDQYVLITLPDGRKLKKDIYHGEGYLSQSPSGIWLTDRVRDVVVKDSKRQSRTIRVR